MNDKPTYYAIIPANVRYDKNLKANEKLMYGEITALTNKNGYCFAKNEYFSNLYGVSKETVSRWISNLQKQNYINVILKYKQGTKEIEKRIISIDNNINTLLTKKSIPPYQKNQYPIDEKVKENITSNNITSINNKKPQKIYFWDELSKEVNKFLKEKKLFTFKEKFNLSKTKKEIKGFEGAALQISEVSKIAKEYVNYIDRNRRKSARFNKWLIAYIENNLADIEYSNPLDNKPPEIKPKFDENGRAIFTRDE